MRRKYPLTVRVLQLLPHPEKRPAHVFLIIDRSQERRLYPLSPTKRTKESPSVTRMATEPAECEDVKYATTLPSPNTSQDFPNGADASSLIS